MVSQRAVQVEHYQRQTDDQWLLTVTEGIETAIEITSLSCRLALADIYDKVVLEPPNPLQIQHAG